MKTILLFLFVIATASAYNINSIKAALSVNYGIEQGSFELFNVSNCQYLPTCFGNNPESPYIQYSFPSWGGKSGPMRPDQAILVIQAAPPQCRYFGYTPYLYSRVSNGQTNILFASVADTLNMNVVNVSADGTTAFVSSPNPRVTANVQNTVAPFLLPNAINTLALPGQLLNLGLASTADTIGFLARYALFTNKTLGTSYLNNIPGYVFLLTPNTPDNSALYLYPSLRPYGPTSSNEDNLQLSLLQLVNAVQANESGSALVQPAIDGENIANYESGFTCINASRNCNGDNRDARYLGSLPLYIQNNSLSHTWVVGVQHQKTGKAVYTAVAAYYNDKMLGVVSVPDTKMNGSAEVFIPQNPLASRLYAIKFARSCGVSEAYCFVVPVNFPGVPLDKQVSFTERVYVEPGYNVAPAAGSVLSPRFIRYVSTQP